MIFILVSLVRSPVRIKRSQHMLRHTPSLALIGVSMFKLGKSHREHLIKLLLIKDFLVIRVSRHLVSHLLILLFLED